MSVTYVDSFNLFGAAVVVQVEQIFDPQQIIESQRNGRYQFADRQINVQIEILLQQYSGQQSETFLVGKVETDFSVQALQIENNAVKQKGFLLLLFLNVTHRGRVISELGILFGQPSEIGRCSVNVPRVHESIVGGHSYRDVFHAKITE